MGERSTYRPGSFCRIELTTTGHGGSTAFDATLFGWEAQAAAQRVRALGAEDGGARTLVAPVEVEVGRFGVVLDPQGGAFGLSSGLLDP